MGKATLYPTQNQESKKLICGWGFKKRKKDTKTFVGLLFVNNIYLKQI
jgi:hypothetical protein